jgi:hypothetical protein
MTTRSPHKRLPGTRWQPPAESLSHPEGTITTSVRGNRLNVTVKLRRTFAVLLGAEHSHGENRQAFLNLYRLWKCFDSGIKIAVCAAVIYIGYEIGSTFLPGGAAYAVITGGK